MKMIAIFFDDDKNQVKTVHFGATGYLDYTIAPHDEERRKIYIKRHKDKENWNEYMTVGTLSRYLLWENKELNTVVNNYYSRFNVKKL